MPAEPMLARVLLLTLACPTVDLVPAQSPLWGGLEPGPFAVGFRASVERDESRTLAGRERSVQLCLWFPRSDGDVEPMRFAAYVALTEPAGDAMRESRADRLHEGYAARSPLFRGATQAATERLMRTTTVATRDASPAAGPFPLLVTIGRVDLHPTLCEYVASHGIVVASVPPIGTGEPRRGPPNAEFYEQCALDLELAIDVAGAHPFVDGARLGVLGFGGGGLFALPVAMRARADAFVSLEAGVFMPGLAARMERVAGYDADGFEAPILHVARDGALRREAASRRAALGTTALIVKLGARGLEHHDLCAAGIASAEVLGLRASARTAVREAFRATAIYTGLFLRAHLCDDDDAAAALLEEPEALGFDDVEIERSP